MYQLTEAQKKFWQQHRYIKLTDFLSAEEKKDMLGWCDEVCAWPETKGKWMQYHETNQSGEKQLCRVENFLDYHPALDAIVRGERLLGIVSELMGEKAVLFKEKINFKFSGGNGFTPHQDAPAFISFNQKFHITLMVAIDRATLENGCLQVIQNNPFQYETLAQNSDGSIAKEFTDTFDWLPVPCQAGDLLLFDSYLPHYSEPNLSNKSRRAIFATYNRLSEGGDTRTRYYQDKREKFPPEIEREPGKDYSAGATIYNVANPVGVVGEKENA